MSTPSISPEQRPEPRWPAIVAIVAAAGLHAALPQNLAAGPPWVLPLIAGAIVIPLVLTHWTGRRGANILLGHLVSGILTIFMLWSLCRLVLSLPSHRESPVVLLRSALELWSTNVLVFALWYWRLDAGGPHRRDERAGHETGAFLFPQMTLDGPAGCEQNGEPWSPQFIDYLFLAFNTSTAFSPTDVPVLSRWAKVLTMIQASISLAVVALLAARAVNIL